jgi:hypothetical protein
VNEPVAAALIVNWYPFALTETTVAPAGIPEPEIDAPTKNLWKYLPPVPAFVVMVVEPDVVFTLMV